MIDGLVLARATAVRSGSGRLSRSSSSSASRRWWRCRPRPFLGDVDGSLVAGVALADLRGSRAVGTLLAAVAAASRGARAAAAASSSSPWRSDRDRRRRRECGRPLPALPRLPGGLRHDLRARLLGLVRVRRHRVAARSERSQVGVLRELPRRSRADPSLLPGLAAVALVLVATAIALIAYVAPEESTRSLAEDLLLPRAHRPDRVRDVSAGVRGRHCSTCGAGIQTPISRVTSRSTRA